jgi:CRP-like cAMP-binding protein
MHGDMFSEAGQPIEEVIFPRSGMISVVVELSDGERIEACMVGRESGIGISGALGGTTHINTSFAQIPGTAWSMRVSDLTELAMTDRAVRKLLFAGEHFLLAQMQQVSACNARHHIPERLAAWLLRAKDASGEEELQVTQEYLAEMLGVQRASVSMFAGALQDKGLIRYRRGRIAITDRPGLEAAACECYAALVGQRERLLGGAQPVTA